MFQGVRYAPHSVRSETHRSPLGSAECNFNISKLNNIFLAPQQHVGTIFDFSNFNETELDIEICYSTCNETLTEQYKVDLNYLHKILSLEPQINDELSALKQINKSLTSLSDKFI